MGEIWLLLYALSAGTTDQLGEVGVGSGEGEDRATLA